MKLIAFCHSLISDWNHGNAADDELFAILAQLGVPAARAIARDSASPGREEPTCPPE